MPNYRKNCVGRSNSTAAVKQRLYLSYLTRACLFLKSCTSAKTVVLSTNTHSKPNTPNGIRLINLETFLQCFLFLGTLLFPITCSIEQLTLHAHPVEIWPSLAIGKFAAMSICRTLHAGTSGCSIWSPEEENFFPS